MTTTNDTDEEARERPRNVIEAVAAVMRDLPAIGKDSEVQGDGPRYKFRGIEAITAAAQKLMGKHGVVFVPRIVGMERRDVSVGSKGAVWDEYAVTVEYDVYGPGGVDDCLPQPARLIGLGRDNSDKGIAKAVTMTYKAAMVQVFCIGDSNNDADNERHENADRARPTSADVPPPDLPDRIKAMPAEALASFPDWLDSQEISRKPVDWRAKDSRRIWAWVKAHTAEPDDDAPTTSREAPVAPHSATTDDSATDAAPNAPEAPERFDEVLPERCSLWRDCVRDPDHEPPCVDVHGESPLDGAELRKAATTYANGLDKVHLLAELGRLNVAASRQEAQQRLQLIDALVASDWQPEPSVAEA